MKKNSVAFFWLWLGFAASLPAAPRIIESHPSDGISEPYAIIENNGHLYKTSEVGTRINAVLWEKLSDDDKKTLAKDVYSWRTDWRQEHFGDAASAAIGDWVDTQNGWKEAGKIWSERIAKREFPDLADFYSQPLTLPVISTSTSLHPSVTETAAYQDYVIMSTLATQEFNEGKEAFDCLQRIKTSQIANATKALSKLIIKDLIVSRVLVPRMLPAPTAAFSELIAESVDFLRDRAGLDITNVESLYGPQTDPVPILQAMDALVERYRNFASANKSSVTAKLEQLRSMAETQAINNDEAWKADRDKAAELKKTSEAKVKTAPTPAVYSFISSPADDTEEKRRATIAAQAVAEFETVRNAFTTLKTEIQEKTTAAFVPIGGAANRYNLFTPVGYYVKSGSMTQDGVTTITYYPFYFNGNVDVPALFTYYPLAKLNQALADFPAKSNQCQEAEGKVQATRQALTLVLDQENAKYQVLRAKMLGLNAYYTGGYITFRPSDYISDSDLLVLIGYLTEETRSLETYQRELASVRETMDQVQRQFAIDLNNHQEALRKQLLPYGSLKANLVNSTSMYLGTITQFRTLHGNPAYRPHPASQPYAYYGFTSFTYGYLFGATYNPIDIDAMNQEITAKTDWPSRLVQGQVVAARLYRVREQEMNLVRRLEIAQSNIFYDMDTLQELLDGLGIPKVVGKSVYQQNLEGTYGHELVQYASDIFNDEIGDDYSQYGYMGSGSSRFWITYKRQNLSSNVDIAIRLLTGQVDEAVGLQDLTATMLDDRDRLLTLSYGEFSEAQGPRWRNGGALSDNADLYSPLILPRNSIAQAWYAFNSAYNQIEIDYFNAHENDTYLGSLTVRASGSQLPLTPQFSPRTFAYGVQVDNAVTSVAVTAPLSNPMAGARVTITGGDALAEGGNLVSVEVSSNLNTRTYVVSVWRQPKAANTDLTLLAPSDGVNSYPLGTPIMANGVLRYPVTVPYAVRALTFSWTRSATAGTTVSARVGSGLLLETFEPVGSARVSGFTTDSATPGLLTLTSAAGSLARIYEFAVYREADKTPPVWPAGAAVTASAVTGSGAQLTFPAATDAGTGIAGYRIYRNASATPAADLPATARSWTASGLPLGTGVQFTVEARDGAGNVSPRLAVQFTTEGTVAFTVAPASGTLAATGGTVACQVTTNTPWTAASSQGWLVPEPASGTQNGPLQLTAPANPGMTTRQATVTVTAGGVVILVTVTQNAGAAKLAATPAGLALLAAGGSATFQIDSNLEWTVAIPADAASWLTVGPAQGRYGTSVTVAVPTNATGMPRSVTLTLSATGKPEVAAKTVQVTQAASDPANVTVTFDAEGGTVSPTDKSVNVNEPYGTLPTPTRSGYTFTGWWTGDNGTGTQVTASTIMTTAANHALHAKYTAGSVLLPTVTTTTPVVTGGGSATAGGNVTGNGGAAVTARGVCWSTTANPTLANAKTTDGAGMGVFTSMLTELSAGATYYVRAYATNSAGTAYGEPRIVSTLTATGPDFVITSMTITPVLPAVGGKFTAMVTVLNQGAKIGKGGNLYVWMNKPATAAIGEKGDKSASISSLKPGQIKVVKLALTAPKTWSTFTLRAFVDAKSVTAETDENNNQRTLVYDTGLPDFEIISARISPEIPLLGKTFTAYVTVVNSGEVAGNAGSLDVWADSSTLATPPVPGSKTKGNKYKTVGILQPGQEKTLTITGLKTPAATAAPVLGLLLDSRAKTLETDEDNDWLDFEYQCQ